MKTYSMATALESTELCTLSESEQKVIALRLQCSLAAGQGPSGACRALYDLDV